MNKLMSALNSVDVTLSGISGMQEPQSMDSVKGRAFSMPLSTGNRQPKKIIDMKRMIIIMMLLAGVMTVYGQKYSVRNKAKSYEAPVPLTLSQDSIPLRDHVYRSGMYLKKSANFEALSLGLGLGAAISVVAIRNEDVRKACAITFAISAVASQICAITFKNKAGQELHLSAGHISLTF